jgi:RNA polymerase sigma-70 factor, ECF subfamily
VRINLLKGNQERMLIDQLAIEAGKNPQAFAQLYDTYYSRVYNYARYRCSDSDQAEDLTAQAFEHLLRAIGAYTPQRGPFEPWLWAVVRNTAISFQRARLVRAALPWEWLRHKAAPGPSPEEITLLRESEAALLSALPALKARQRDLLGLRYSTGLTNSQIAALTGLSESNVAVTLHRAIETLRQVLSSQADPGYTRPAQKEKEHAKE